MSHRAIRIGITSVVLTLAFCGLLWSTLSEGTEYFKHVDEVTEDPATWQGKKLKVHGFIVDESIMRRPDTLDYRFEIEHNDEVIKAEYTGIVPDTFKSGAEVVVSGQLGGDGFIVAPNGVMAKCPSKYEPKTAVVSPAAGYSGGQ